jgi:hypothetical protein
MIRTVVIQKRCATGVIALSGKRDLRRSTPSFVTGHFNLAGTKLHLRLLIIVTVTVSIITTIIPLTRPAPEIPRRSALELANAASWKAV